MALTFTIKYLGEQKGIVQKQVKIEFGSTAYVTNGLAVAASDCQLRTLLSLNLGSGAVNGYPVEWDQDNLKIKAYKAVGTEMDNADATSLLNGVLYAIATGY